MKDFKTLKNAAESAKEKFSVYERQDVKLSQNKKDATSKAKKLEKSIRQNETELSETLAKQSALEQVRYN